MTPELGILIGYTAFISILFYFSLARVREAHRETVESLKADQKALHSLLKDAQNRIHAATLHDYLALSGRENEQAFEPMRRSDAIEAEIAARGA